jgi:TonB-linked SusC/RagA family outer membrane protein
MKQIFYSIFGLRKTFGLKCKISSITKPFIFLLLLSVASGLATNAYSQESASKSKPKTVTVNGTVTDEKGEALTGVAVRVKGNESIGTGTNIDGKYILDIPAGVTLIFSYLGYKTQEIAAGTNKIINAVLQTNDALLDEVTVVGYGVQKKISMIGAQSSVSVKEVKVPVRNLTNSLGGRVAGVVSVQSIGEPGYDDAQLYIRGIATLTTNMAKPLTLVDGVQRSFSDVDPEDIETFSILKDASATAVYGVNGANGVILITTKGGKAGKPKFNIRYTEGVTRFTKLPELADGVTYMNMANEATRGSRIIFDPDRIENTRTGVDPYLYPNVDWMEAVFGDYGRNRSANANISGGSEKATYYIGLGYYDELGLYDTSGMDRYNCDIYYRRYSVTSNLNIDPTHTTNIKLGIQGYLANANYPATGSGDIYNFIFQLTPVSFAKTYPDGKIPDQRTNTLTNPYALLTQTGYANQWRSQLFSNLRITQQLPFITKGLSVSGMFSFDNYSYFSARRSRIPDRWLAIGRDLDGELIYEQTSSNGNEYLIYGKSVQGNRTVYGEFSLNYDRDFGKHGVTAMLLYNQRDLVNTEATTYITSLPYRQQGLAGRSTYGYNDRYFFEFNFGYNGSENFAPDKRYGFFPSMGLGWVLSSESFFEPVHNAVQFAKLRFSYGTVGNSIINDNARRFAYLPTVNDGATGYRYGTSMNQIFAGKAFGEYGVDVTWETAIKTNAGIDLMMLGNSLNLQLDFFHENRSGIFLQRQAVPDYLGIATKPWGNLGKVENKGLDGSVTYNHTFGDFHIDLMGNFTFSRNKVLENDEAPTVYPWQEKRGLKVGQRFGYIAIGLFESDDEVARSPLQSGDTRAGDIKYKDLNGDGKIDSYDIAPIGYGSIPEIMYGFGFTLGYKNISLSTLFQGAANQDKTLSGEGLLPFIQGEGRGQLAANITDRWTPGDPRQDAFYPRLTMGSVNMNYAASTWWLKRSDYIRLKTLQLTWMLPAKWTKKAGLDSANLFFQGVNMFTWSPFQLWDVELPDGRGATYPNISSYSVGLNFSF